MIRWLRSSEEARGTELPLRGANLTSANSTTFDAISNPADLGLGSGSLNRNQRVGAGISGLIDDANHAGLAMVVLVLRAVEGDRAGVLDGHGEGGLTVGLAGRALQETRVEGAIGLAGGAAGSSSGSDGVVSGDPNELDSVTNGGSDGSRGVDPLATCANLDLVGGGKGSGNASRSGDNGLGEMHG